ncbi:MAG: iron complex outerrane recepter protein [Verrucomicrobiota bacterium]
MKRVHTSTQNRNTACDLRRKRFRLCFVTSLLVAWLLPVSVAPAQEALKPRAPNFVDLSLEELMDVAVTTVSKKETTLLEAPAAISIVTQDDLRRLGITTIPEALRSVPGLDIARIDANQWAVSSRGFNGQNANKLLVLVDGRSVYTPSFGGVFWNAQDTVLEDLDRIEVIRGPGATLWGSNAVNGVINIISKNSKDTQGILASTSLGTEDQPSVSFRYGGQLAPNLTYRAYAKYFNREGLVDSHGGNTEDGWKSIRAGFRTDWEPSKQELVTFQGDYYSLHTQENVAVPSLVYPFSREVEADIHDRGGNALARWTRTFSTDSHLSIQAYFDYFEHEQDLAIEKRKTADIQLEHGFKVLRINDVLWGLEYRFTTDEFTDSPVATWAPNSKDLHLFTAFLQDEITLVPDRLRLTVGSKFEHNDYTGFEIQPSGRLLWTPGAHQSIWTSLSRAISTPSRVETGAQINNLVFQPSPFVPVAQTVIFGNPNLQSEKVTAYELGYRVEPAHNLSFDAAAFYNVYEGIQNPVAGTPYFAPSPAPGHLVVPLTWENAISGQGYGTELSVQWKPLKDWRLIASYSWLQMHLTPANVLQKASPEHQLSLRSYVNLPWNFEFNSAAYFVDQVELSNGSGTVVIPAYIRVDAGLVWHPKPSLEVGIWGQNLLDNQHPESNSYYNPIRTEIPRSVVGKITWRY